MQKIKAIFSDIIDLRNNSAISFDDAGENEAYSAKVYWEYLNRLNEAIQDHLKAFKFFNQITIKDNLIQIEIYLPNCKPPEHTPYATFQFGHSVDIPKNVKDFYHMSGNLNDIWYFNETFQQHHVIDAEQIHALFDNLKKCLDGDTMIRLPIKESQAVSCWRNILKGV